MINDTIPVILIFIGLMLFCVGVGYAFLKIEAVIEDYFRRKELKKPVIALKDEEELIEVLETITSHYIKIVRENPRYAAEIAEFFEKARKLKSVQKATLLKERDNGRNNNKNR